MLSYIHEHYQEDISLFHLADYLNLSRNYVSTLFKNTVGRNFKDYLGEYRHQIACRIMQEQPHKKIKEVAEMVGCNTEILTRLFTRYSGMAPSDYLHQVTREQES
jgi:two-component system response regulator YesN